MSNWAELEDMISYGRERKYFTGRQIKDIINRCLTDEMTLGSRKKELEAFKESYISCKYPLSNNGLYMLKWKEESSSMLKSYNIGLKCYKRKENKHE